MGARTREFRFHLSLKWKLFAHFFELCLEVARWRFFFRLPMLRKKSFTSLKPFSRTISCLQLFFAYLFQDIFALACLLRHSLRRSWKQVDRTIASGLTSNSLKQCRNRRHRRKEAINSRTAWKNIVRLISMRDIYSLIKIDFFRIPSCCWYW